LGTPIALNRSMEKITATIKRECLREIAAGPKRVEHREIKPYWTQRFTKTSVPFRLRLSNGMQRSAPEMTVLVQRIRKNMRSRTFELHLGRVVEVRNWDVKRDQPAKG
jgi:hypothetical protein